MLSESEAKTQIEKELPGVVIKAWTIFQDFYLFHIEYPSPWEKDWDPFFSVDNITGEVRDFSVLTDITSSEFAKLKWTDL